MAKILIIDDDPLIRSTLTSLFAEMGHEADKALTLTDGVRKAHGSDYDVVYLDIDLPDGSGLSSISEISNAPSNPEVILITGIDGRDGAALAVRNGAWGYIEKPASMEAVRLPLLTALQYRAERAKHPVGNQKAKTEEGRGSEVPEPEESQEPISWKRYKVKCERRYFKELMQYTGYDLNEAAEVSGLGIHSLYKYLKRNGIPTKRPRLV